MPNSRASAPSFTSIGGTEHDATRTNRAPSLPSRRRERRRPGSYPPAIGKVRMTRLPFTNDIRTLRFLAGEMTQGELGDRVGVTRQTIAAIEQGKYSPSLEVAFRIAHVFGKSLEDVFQWQAEGAQEG
ncbi:MAG: helix-turn-helix transcriptional regulator [Sphingopyxis sp.]|nr:helix-turn-helix transcriptional regulator [Sphingopyxis sp.]MDZ3830250.1 helix-turn-helix transcriptional regulator [Sphingopyxis sp.]